MYYYYPVLCYSFGWTELRAVWCWGKLPIWLQQSAPIVEHTGNYWSVLNLYYPLNNIIQNISRILNSTAQTGSGTILEPDLSCIESEPEKTKHINGRFNCPIILETYSTDVMEEEAISDEVLELEELAAIPDASMASKTKVSPPDGSMANTNEASIASKSLASLTEYHTCRYCGKVCSR